VGETALNYRNLVEIEVSDSRLTYGAKLYTVVNRTCQWPMHLISTRPIISEALQTSYVPS
jgi:hypothetical protein